MKNVNKVALKSALTTARKLQRQYNALGSPNTQRVRNPFPMHQLVVDALPKLQPLNDEYSTVTKTLVRVNGQLKRVTVPITITRKSIINAVGMTVDEVTTALRVQGYNAPKYYVRQILSNLNNVTVASASVPRVTRGIGRGISKYVKI